MFYQLLLKQRFHLQTQKLELEKKLALYPKEHLVLSHNGPYDKWYKSDGQSETYIPKKDKPFAVMLAHKKYDFFRLQEITQELSLIDSFLSKHSSIPQSSQLLFEDTSFCKLYSDISSNNSNALQEWLTEDYPKNSKYPNQLQHKCLSGQYVRSKSEVIIANTLFTHHIPYRYECELVLGNDTFYPDFTIFHPLTSNIIYWEHFGMMDIPSYCDQTYSKLKHFSHYGILPGIQLITTYETKQNPINSEQIEQIVSNYFEM